MGQSWTAPQYLVGFLVAQFGSKLYGKIHKGGEANFRRGAIELLFTKLVWTEGISRSPMARTALGTYENQISYDQGTGQTWQNVGGRDVAMQGELVHASPLDGELVHASPLDGGLLPPTVSDATDRFGRYSRSGYKNKYLAAYTAA
jgi:hypothetical protein